MGAIIGTAGHIDHGKTSLVKALTGQDTDRLKEEKERGISIDLGFAYLDLPDGTRAGVVDVPGHERFIRNMLAGAHGIDVALFTVAADDGVMPQTEEHLDIVHLLRIPQAIFVVTKVDLVSASRVSEVEEEIRTLVAGTAFERSAVVPFSFVTGEGLEEVRRQIAETISSSGKPRAHGYFRLPVDRVFVLQGHGLVVTGTAIGGEVKIADRVRSLPGQHLFRIRSLHVHNQPVECANEGQRVALNLAGSDRPLLTRGDVIVDEALTLTSSRFDAWLELRPAAKRGVKNHQRVRVHLGTAERLASVRLFGGSDRIAAEESTYCQIVLVDPLPAMRGDHFVIRDETAQRTLGGGVVVHPWPRKHRRNESKLRSQLETLHLGTPAMVIETFLDDAAACAVPASVLSQFLNAPEGDVAARVEQTPEILAFDLDGQRVYTTGRKLQQLKERLHRALREFHAMHPLAAGMDLEAMRDAVSTLSGKHTEPDPGVHINLKLFRTVVDQLTAAGEMVREANLVRLPQHAVRLNDNDRTLKDRMHALLGANALAPPALGDLERQLGVSRARIGEMIRVMERERLVVRVAADMYFVSEAIDRALQVLDQRWSGGVEFTLAAFRDAVGTTRRYAIPLLEYFDRVGVTVRVNDVRRLKKASPALS
jgi:selenocysteine-specific elongation factor